jgi:hypothetical protein
VVLTGRGLERIEKLTSKYARIDWDAGRREARVLLAAKAPAEIDVEAHVEGRHQPLRLARALRALGPKPLITAVTRAPQQAGPVERLAGEIDVAMPAAFSMKVQNLPGVAVALACKEPGMTVAAVEGKALDADTLYFTVPAGLPVGCTLEATVGGSNAASLGKTVALPVLTGFVLTDEPGAEVGTFKGVLRGAGLEAIARTGWTADSARDVAALPAPEGAGQKLDIVMPWPAPAPHAPLRVWLRGETESRLTTAKF